jgi:hypothetical protein
MYLVFPAHIVRPSVYVVYNYIHEYNGLFVHTDTRSRGRNEKCSAEAMCLTQSGVFSDALSPLCRLGDYVIDMIDVAVDVADAVVLIVRA